jgi:hypothetical protein
MGAVLKYFLLIACFFTVCSFKGFGELSKVLTVLHQYQQHPLDPEKICIAGINNMAKVGDHFCFITGRHQ